MSSAKISAGSDSAVPVVKPTAERPLDAHQFYAINLDVFKAYEVSDDMIMSLKEIVTFTVGDKQVNVHKEVLVGCKVWETAFKLPLKEAQEKHYKVLFELDSETNSEFEFQAHLVLFLVMYGVTKLPEDQYGFATSAGPVLIRALALADYRDAQDYIVNRLNLMVTRYFSRMLEWKDIPHFNARSEIDKLWILEINDTFIAYKYSNIKNRKFPLRAFANLIAIHCPAHAFGMFQAQMEEDLIRRVGTASMFVNQWLDPKARLGNFWERRFLGLDDQSLYRIPN